MTVESVLKRKGGVIFATTPEALIADVVGRFKKNKAGSLMVISQEGKLVGILTERDLIYALGDQGTKVLELPVLAIMAKTKLRCHLHDTVARALELMGRSKTRYLPVVEKNRLLGVISLLDLIEEKLSETEDDANWMKEYIAGDYSISYDNAG